MTRIAKVRMTLDVILDVDMDSYDPSDIGGFFGNLGTVMESADFEVVGIGEADE